MTAIPSRSPCLWHAYPEELCDVCFLCPRCCNCRWEITSDFDADELGLDPEEDYD